MLTLSTLPNLPNKRACFAGGAALVFPVNCDSSLVEKVWGGERINANEALAGPRWE